ncbi:putative reverse transcriptase domain-containing protein [Tanacetum coccineum]
MEVMIELHASGKYAADNVFKPGYPQALQDLMDVSLPNSGLQADPHIKSRLKTLKGNFGAMHDMVLGSSTSGFGWDPDKCVVTAPNDVWDAYVKCEIDLMKRVQKEIDALPGITFEEAFEATDVIGSLVVGRSRLASTVPGEMANPLIVGALGTTLSIMMVVAFRAQRFRYSVRFLFPKPCSIGSCHIVPFERLLLVLVVP